MHKATSRFWKTFSELPTQVQKIARKNFELLKSNPYHPSLHFKKIGKIWSVRIGLEYRALAIRDGEDFIWFWIGTHEDYDRLING
jgi:hypothetical protein